jgi:hypothetical protein
MQTYLFIGGNQNGLKIPAAGRPEYVQPTGREIYLRETLTLGSVSTTVYVHESLTQAQALELLMGHYRAWCVNRPGGRL